MAEPVIVRIPKESVSDDDVLLARWLVPHGGKVRQGVAFAVIETSKNAVDVDAPADGYLQHLAPEGARVGVGEPFAVIAADAPGPATSGGTGRAVRTVSAPTAGARFSNAAKQLIEAHGLDPAAFAHLSLVRREDVEAHIKASMRNASALPTGLPPAAVSDILLWGGGGHAKVCIEIIRAAGTHTIYGIVDRGLPIGTNVLGVPVVASDTAIEQLRAHGVRAAVLGIGAVRSHAERTQMLRRLREAGYELPNLVHPSAVVSPSASMGVGNVVFAHATISSDVRIGDGCIVNSGVVVSHDCRLGNNVHLAPGALLAGAVEVGDDTLIGMGTAVFLGTRVGCRVRINNGATVDADVQDGAVVHRS